jgi:LuxR family maltose regulon positive regulatory protein
VRADDLRLTSDEAADYLAAADLALSSDDVRRLVERTEGWVAGLQLAALSLRGRRDVSAFISAFTGDHTYVADYLVGEVLGRVPGDVRDLLLRTSVLDAMTGGLCDAVTGRQDGARQLVALEHGGYFLVPLDSSRHRYRYQPLFGEVLRAYLHEEQPEQVQALHRRASAWYDRAGSPGPAIRHALAAHDVERAADLVEAAAPEMHRTRREGTALAWFQALPEAVFARRPVLSAFYAATLLVSGRLDGVERRLQAAERWLGAATAEEPGPGPEMVVVDVEAFRHLPASLAMWRAGLALWAGDVPETERQAHRALELLGDEEHQLRGSASAVLGLAAWSRGTLEEAYVLYASGRDRLRTDGLLPDAVACAITLADIRTAQGRSSCSRGCGRRTTRPAPPTARSSWDSPAPASSSRAAP